MPAQLVVIGVLMGATLSGAATPSDGQCLATEECRSGADNVELMQLTAQLKNRPATSNADLQTIPSDDAKTHERKGEALPSVDAGTHEKICYDLDVDCGTHDDRSTCSAWWLTSATEELRKTKCCHCGGGSTHEVVAKSDQDTLSVMTFNTYLIRVKVVAEVKASKNLDDRAARISEWFGSLADHEVPDVVVLQEIYSDEGEDLMRKLCSDRWRRNSNFWGNHNHGKHLVCDQPGSKFGHATPSANPSAWWNPMKASGTVVLVKKGNLVISAKDLAFDDCHKENCITRRGVWGVEFYKGTQRYWVFGTHTTAWQIESYRESRHRQFKQLREFVDELAKDNSRVAIAGDMNIFIAPFEYEGKHYTPETRDADGELRWNELERMMGSLGAPEAPATAGDLVERGFWLPLDVPMNASCDPAFNHFNANIEGEVELGGQLYDWVVAPGPGDRLATPKTLRYQVAPVKADECYDSELVKGQKADDTSDHFAVFAEMRFTDSAPAVGVVTDHRGAGASFPAGPSCAQ